MIYIFYRSWVDTRGQQYITHLRTNSTLTHKQDTYTQTRHLHTNSTHNTEIGKFGSAGRAPFCELYPGICLTAEEKHGKTSVRVANEQ
jgi:hypothetical protein